MTAWVVAMLMMATTPFVGAQERPAGRAFCSQGTPERCIFIIKLDFCQPGIYCGCNGLPLTVAYRFEGGPFVSLPRPMAQPRCSDMGITEDQLRTGGKLYIYGKLHP